MNQFQQLLETVGLARVSIEIMKVALPSIRLNAHPMEEERLEQWTTKFGGSPGLSAGYSWPACDGMPLPFVAQINLSEAASYDPRHLLPTRGLLSFSLISMLSSTHGLVARAPGVLYMTLVR